MGRQSREAEDRKYFMCRIEEMEEDLECGILTKEMPRPEIVKYHDLLGKIWGWDKLLPMGAYVLWSDYSAYLQEYHCRNADAVSSTAALAQTCLNSEEQLVSECQILMKSEFLPMRKSVVLSCLIHERCIAKQAELTRELLRHGADSVDDYLIDISREIRTCALGLMNCTSDNSVAASALMLGMAKEAEMMCAWMSTNNKPVDFSDFIPDEIVDSRIVRHETLNVMIDILEESSAAAAAGHKIGKEGPAGRNGPGCDGITADGAANTTGCGISDVLNSEYKKKIKGGEKSKIQKVPADLFEKLWGWERLLPLSRSVKWADYYSYLEKYYERNASEFVAGALANPNPEDSQMANNAYTGVALAKYCLKMEEDFLSYWKTRVKRSMNNTLTISTIIQSSLIKELALSVCSTGGELFAPSDVAFACIANEAELMSELLKHGAEPFDDMIQQSSVIRMCALGLAHLRGHQSISPAAAMLGMANESKKMCDWIKREKKLVTLSLCEPHDLEECRLIRIKTLDVMTRILHDSSFPCRNIRDDLMACD